MDGMTGMCKIENYRGGRHGGTNRNYNNIARDCGVVDPCSPFYRSYLRAVRWVAEQCEQFLDDQQNYSIDKIIKDIMTAQLVPNNDDYVVLGPKLDRPMSPGIWLEEKTARLVRELQRDYNSHNPSKYFGEFKTPCGRTMEQIRSQFYIDCFSECIQPQSSRGMKANTTECVPVPSSEHVAEIVGKKGGKIKNIRAETNTYIKTPKRDEEPVFVITGRKEDVAFAKQKILAAAEHFSQLREARRQNPGGPAPAVGPPKREGDVTVSVEVPYEFVGLVVGQKGATIKRIQQDTSTYITTPSRRHRPIFEVVGQPADVELARQAIQMHINSRVEKFRGDSASSAGDSFRPASSMSFAGIDDSVFGAPPPAAGDLFCSLSNANLGGTWTGVPPPPLPQYAPPPPTPCPQYGGGRLSAFRNIGVEGLESLSATLMDLALSEPADATCWLDGRGRTASLPAADPADPPFGRRGSDEPPAFGGVLFGRAGALGWDAPALTMPRRASKGSSETLNSDSGIETTTPPPLDGLLFGPIGSKRTSPTALLLAD